jgi:hypothetical protein
MSRKLNTINDINVMERLSLALIFFFSLENKIGRLVLTPCPFHKGCRKQLRLSAEIFQVFCLIKTPHF